MSASSRPRTRRRALLAAGVAALLAPALAACGSSGDAAPARTKAPSGTATTGTATTGAAPSTAGTAHDGPTMPGMDHMAGGNGLSDAMDGYRLTSTTRTLAAGRPGTYRFTVTGPDGGPVTDFAVDQTKRLHFYAVRSDLTGFQHLHPVMAADGTWRADLAELKPGAWRMFATFTPGSGPGRDTAFVLSRTVAVPGPAAVRPLPAPARSVRVDGYTVNVAGRLMAGMEHPLTVTITKAGRPVTDLQPYLDSYAHLTAFHQGDGAFAHLHPTARVHGDHGGPDLSFHAELPSAGHWRLFLQFQAAGTLHTAALTLDVA